MPLSSERLDMACARFAIPSILHDNRVVTEHVDQDSVQRSIVWCCPCRCKKDELVRVRVAARLADRAYAGVMGCGGYRLEDSPMEDVAPNESYLQVGKRLFTLETALGELSGFLCDY